ncbi:MAG: site-specific DNA-methyltransferase [Candidatus Falkowbacteria bacterium]|nr:site-specific DNA-methyltransferase [Candidatus Falkowbacteria bacterium]
MSIDLSIIEKDNNTLEKKFKGIIQINPDLKRSLVSFQANKALAGYRWYKFKEGYSSSLVEYVLKKLNIKNGALIDPFAGSGTSLFVANENGINAVGIELLPIGQKIIEVRKKIIQNSSKKILETLKIWLINKPWISEKKAQDINYLNITRGAFPKDTEIFIGKYITSTNKEKNPDIREILIFVFLCILEEISFTRKDGQYLRWDYRSGRGEGKNAFNKGIIKKFDEAIVNKLNQIIEDIEKTNIDIKINNKKIDTINGSCLEGLKKLKTKSFDILMTSPPYCNRYDYTRTYALELALLGANEESLKKMRQDMMSCTVENKDKNNLEESFSKNVYRNVSKAFNGQKVLQDILKYLEQEKIKKTLNNPGIVRMVKNYFFELSLIIFESARILKKGAYFVMVNDNVRYAGINIPVDLILSDIAQNAKLKVEKIWVLPTGKGNSSQQMGKHGRQELRKCVYLWKKL